MFPGGGVGIEFAPGFNPLTCTVLKVWLAGGGWRKILVSLERDMSTATTANAPSVTESWRLLRITQRCCRPPAHLSVALVLRTPRERSGCRPGVPLLHTPSRCEAW